MYYTTYICSLYNILINTPPSATPFAALSADQFCKGRSNLIFPQNISIVLPQLCFLSVILCFTYCGYSCVALVQYSEPLRHLGWFVCVYVCVCKCWMGALLLVTLKTPMCAPSTRTSLFEFKSTHTEQVSSLWAASVVALERVYALQQTSHGSGLRVTNRCLSNCLKESLRCLSTVFLRVYQAHALHPAWEREVYACVCVCACVCEREKHLWHAHHEVDVLVCVCVYVCVYVRLR